MINRRCQCHPETLGSSSTVTFLVAKAAFRNYLIAKTPFKAPSAASLASDKGWPRENESVWARVKQAPKPPKLLVACEPTAQYQTSFVFHGIAKRIVFKIIGKEMDRAIARALASKN